MANTSPSPAPRSPQPSLARQVLGLGRTFWVANAIYFLDGAAYFVPAAPALSPVGAVQLNDVYVDDRRIVYSVDRFVGGLYILEMTL